MKKLVVLVIAALLFVSCEKKGKENEKPAAKAVVVAEAKIACLGLTIDKPSDLTITEATKSCNMSAGTYRMAVMEGAAYAKPTLKEAMKDNSTKSWSNIKGEETANGYYITYDQHGSLNLMALQNVNGKDYFFTGAANDKKGQESLIAIVKSAK